MNNERVAVIDLGSNTFNLLIAEQEDTGIRRIYNDRIPVKLGSGSFEKKLINKEAISRALNAVERFKTIAHDNRCSKIFAFATSAIRDAKNGLELKNKIQQYGIDVKIIDGNQEADYIYRGAKASGIIEQTSLIMDIGGGSTEFIIANNEDIIWKKSYPLGITRLYDKFNPSQRITKTEIKNIKQHILRYISDLIQAFEQYSPQCLIGTAGSFETYADIIYKQTDYLKSNQLNWSAVEVVSLKKLLSQLIESDTEYRKMLKQLPEFRRDLIVVSSVFLELILEELNIKDIRFTDFALKEGAFYSVINKK